MIARTEAGQAGFTALDLLISLLLLASVATLAASSISLGSRILRTTDEELAKPSVGSVQSVLRDYLAGARVVRPNVGSERSAPSFIGTREGIVFVTSHSRRGQYAGLYRVEFRSEDAGPSSNGNNLVLKMSPYRPTQPDAASGKGPAEVTAVLLRGLSSIEWGYFGSNEVERQPTWHSAWSNDHRVPKLVSVEVRFSPWDTRVWPKLLVQMPAAR